MLLHQETPLPAVVATPGEGLAREHTVYFYDGEETLVRVVASFLGEGMAGGDGVVVIATAPHLRALKRALEEQGHDPEAARREGSFLAVRADEALAQLMDGPLPDADRFRALLEPMLERARAASDTGRVRAFGEMVSLLWERGNAAATVQLEELWSDLIDAQPVSLLCGYRLADFPAREHASAFHDICGRHRGVEPAGRYGSLATPEEKLQRVAELEQRAQALEVEAERRERIEAERARLYEKERRARAEIALLYRLTDAANRAETLDQVYDAALDGIATALGVSRAAILLFDSDGVMRFKAWRGLSESYRAAVEGHSPWRPEDRDPPPLLCEDVRSDPALSRFLPVFAAERVGALGFFPLCHAGRLLGKLVVYHPEPYAFTDAELRVAGAIAGQVAFAVDRQLSTMERERLLGIVGHDLRNPLSAITMSAGWLLRQDLREGTTRSVRRILTSAERMERLITQLVQFAQARHGTGITLHRQAADLGEVMRHVAEELEAAHPHRELVLEIEGILAGDWDADRLGEVFSNLIANALQHGGDGAVDVRLVGSEAEVVAEVHNGGERIPAAVLPDLFAPFRRGSGAGTGRSRSVGLGLFISREIVRAHGGTIEVESTAEDGTTFRVRIPRAAAIH